MPSMRVQVQWMLPQGSNLSHLSPLRQRCPVTRLSAPTAEPALLAWIEAAGAWGKGIKPSRPGNTCAVLRHGMRRPDGSPHCCRKGPSSELRSPGLKGYQLGPGLFTSYCPSFRSRRRSVPAPCSAVTPLKCPGILPSRQSLAVGVNVRWTDPKIAIPEHPLKQGVFGLYRLQVRQRTVRKDAGGPPT